MKAFKIAVSLLLVLSLLFCLAGCKQAETAEEESTTQTQFNDVDNTDETEYYEGEYTEYYEEEYPSEEQDSSDSTSASAPTDTSAPQGSSAGTTVATPESTRKPSAPSTTQRVTQAEVTTSTTSGVSSYTEAYGGHKQTVFYPNSIKTSKKTLPVLSWANGTGFSYTIYEKLLIKLAEGGYIVVACDETMSADGTAQITSLDFVIAEGSDPSSVLYKKVNTQKMAAIGHSQGGRSSVNAAVKDSRISCVISFAGSNYVEEAELLNTPTLFFAGEKDFMVIPKTWIIPAYEASKGTAVYASLKGGGHTACCTNPDVYSVYALSWLDLWLKNDTSAKSTFTDGGKLSKDSAWTGFRCKGL